MDPRSVTVTTLLERVKAEGCTVTLAGDRLRLAAPRPLPAPLLETLRARKPEIVAHLREQAELALDRFEERAAIREHDGGEARPHAEEAALEEAMADDGRRSLAPGAQVTRTLPGTVGGEAPHGESASINGPIGPSSPGAPLNGQICPFSPDAPSAAWRSSPPPLPAGPRSCSDEGQPEGGLSDNVVSEHRVAPTADPVCPALDDEGAAAHPDARAMLALLAREGPMSYGAAARALGWGATRAWQAAARLKAARRISHDHLGRMVPLPAEDAA